MESLFGILFQTMPNYALKRGRHVLIALRQIGRIFFQDRAHRLSCGFTVKSSLAGEHLVEDRSERKDVRAMIYWTTSHLLRRHVPDCSHDHSRIRIDAPGWNVCFRLSIGGVN